MSDLITDEIFSDGQQNIAASNMNGIVGRARVQPDVIANKVASSTLNVADQMLILKTDNTLARARFDTIVNSVSSSAPLADSTKNGMLRQVSGRTTDFVDGTNNCQPISNFLPAGVVVSYAGPNIPAGWLYCDGRAVSRTTYSALFAAIGGYYGTGDGSTTFNIPNCVGRFVGYIAALGAVGGVSAIALSVGNLPAHNHPITDQQHAHTASGSDSGHSHSYLQHAQGQTQAASGAGAWAVGGGSANNTATSYANIAVSVAAAYSNINHTENTGSGAAFSIYPPYISMYFIIKY